MLLTFQRSLLPPSSRKKLYDGNIAYRNVDSHLTDANVSQLRRMHCGLKPHHRDNLQYHVLHASHIYILQSLKMNSYYVWDRTRRTCLDEERRVADHHKEERQPDHENDDHEPINGHKSSVFCAVGLKEVLPLSLL